MKNMIVIHLATAPWWLYDKDGNRLDRYEKKDDKTIEIYDKDYNRKGHIRKEGDLWIEYDKRWKR